MKPPLSTTSPFIVATLFAAMMGALIYQGISQNIPPDFLGAAVFLAGIVIALRLGFRRRRAPRTLGLDGSSPLVRRRLGGSNRNGAGPLG